ncbi:MAG: hypothetical protein JWL62_201 [Hyphomicrobiales bacterium]|nr:hypothetical protein [Hyphomicrobiales bacterium]
MRVYILSSVSVLALMCNQTQAATATATLGVSVTIAAACTISTTPLAFGTQGVLTANIDQTGTVILNCTKNTAYSVGFDQGANGTSVTARKMKNGSNTDTISYSLFKDAARTVNWGTATVPETLQGTASAPVLLDVQAAGDAATSITLRNPSNTPLVAQLRVYRWTQIDGRDVLSETGDVAASPPAVTLKPNSDYTVRVVRLTRKPITGEESYRLLADEIPDEKALKAGAVNLVVRQSIPVFFRSPSAAPADVAWSAVKSNGRLAIRAANKGDRRMRVTRLHVTDKGGELANFGDGLVGYVLGHASAAWTSRSAVKGFSGGSAKLAAVTETGPLEASVPLR